jgi:hypothetical protein
MAAWNNYISYDNSSDLVIDHNGNHSHRSNRTETIYLRAASLGNVEAHKTIYVNYIVGDEAAA